MTLLLGGYHRDLNIVELDTADGSMRIVGSVQTPQNASFFRYVAEFSVVYATVEAGAGAGGAGSIAAFRLDEPLALVAIGTASSCGAGPCHLDVDPRGRLLTAANYGGASFVAMEISADGGLGDQIACVRHEGQSVNPKRQAEPHPHATTFSPDRRAVYVCDLGIDRIMRYAITDLRSPRSQAAGTIAAQVTPGAGPRHLEFSADARFAYLVTELANTVVAYACEDDGSLRQLQEISMLPDDFDGQSAAAEIQIHPNGRFLYASNRGHDSIAVFGRDEATGMLEAEGHVACGGEGPRHFRIDASGEWCVVSNQASDLAASLRIDPATGRATPTGATVSTPSPSCAVFIE